MTKKRRKRNPISDGAIDAIEDLKTKRDRRRMSPEERAEAERQTKRHRVTYDVPRGVSEAIKAAAEQEGISASAMASLLLANGLRRHREERLSLDRTKRKSPSPGWRCAVDDRDILAVLRGDVELEERVEEKPRKPRSPGQESRGKPESLSPLEQVMGKGE